MQFSLESLAAVATIIGTAVALISLVQTGESFVLASLLFVSAALGLALYTVTKKRVLAAASTVIEGHSIDSLNVASLRQRVNRKLLIQEAHDCARITGENLEITWRYSGYCKVAGAAAFEFSVDSDKNIPFGELECVGYDLGHDRQKSHAIEPMLIGPEGLSKLISVPFLQPLAADERFEIMLKCKLPGCVNFGVSYYTSTLSFDQKQVNRFSVELEFVGENPEWVRVYESRPKGPPALVRTLMPTDRPTASAKYRDSGNNRRGQSARIYMFSRSKSSRHA